MHERNLNPRACYHANYLMGSCVHTLRRINEDYMYLYRRISVKCSKPIAAVPSLLPLMERLEGIVKGLGLRLGILEYKLREIEVDDIRDDIRQNINIGLIITLNQLHSLSHFVHT